MRLLELKERKEISLSILKELNEVCVKHHIPYFLAYGTLIGAVRHNGFIPWDDDIDIWVPISYMNDLLMYLEDESKYEVINHLKDEKWPRAFSKLSDPNTIIIDNDDIDSSIKRGVAVDIFPLYGCDDISNYIKKLEMQKNMIVKIFDTYNSKRKKEYNLINIFKLWYIKMNVLLGRDSFYWRKKLFHGELQMSSNKFVGCTISPYREKDVHLSKDFATVEKVMFEGYYFPAPNGKENVLKNLYGDFMKLPPEKERVSNHNVKAYFLEEKNED